MSVKYIPITVLCLLFALLGSPRQACGQSREAQVSVPIVMEEGTVRGKVAILETRREDRQVVEGLQIAVWTTKRDSEAEKALKRWQRGREILTRDEIIFETETDIDGFFDIDAFIEQGEYFMSVGEADFRLTVIPKLAARIGQGSDESKVLLILIPKDVISL